jgi:hypothetical protein
VGAVPPGWSIDKPKPSSIKISANSNNNNNPIILKVTASNPPPESDLLIDIKVSVKDVPKEDTEINYTWAYDGIAGRIHEHPDEWGPGEVNISDPNYPSPAIVSSEADIGVLLGGFPDGVAHLLGNPKINEPVWFIDKDLTPLGGERTLKDFSVLILPTYSLSGINSEIFKAILDDYVSSGGTLICFTQRYGEGFELLPGKLAGYGGNQDQSCHSNAVYIDSLHSIISGQSKVCIDSNVDGYLTKYPNESIILLRRTKNGYPAMLAYPYGKGWVVVSSLFTDYGYGHSQVYGDELNLIRDLISWAKSKVKDIPQYEKGEAISEQLTVNSEQATGTAEKVRLKVYNPNKNLLTTYYLQLRTCNSSSSKWDHNYYI